MEHNQGGGGRELLNRNMSRPVLLLSELLLGEAGPSAQGLGSYDSRFEIPTCLDRDEDAGLLDLYGNLFDDEDEETS